MGLECRLEEFQKTPAEIIEKGGHAVNARGELYSEENIKQRLNMRDFMDTLRSSGVDTGGQAAMSQIDRRDFAYELDRCLQKARAHKCD